MKALLTGFEGFAGKMNPSGVIAKSLDKKRLGELEISGRELPEDFRRLPNILHRLIDGEKPDIVIGTGWDYVSQIKVEKISLNVQNSVFGDKVVPDNYNHKPKGNPIIDKGALALRATFPAEKIVESLKKRKIPATISYNAGTHCCNTVMYSAIFYSQSTKRSKAIAGFIHIPPIAEMKMKNPNIVPMTLEEETRAIEGAIETCRKYLG
jgi:pyroglutamyl-peptidase